VTAVRAENASFDGNVYALTLLTGVRPGSAHRLRRALAGLRRHESPFALPQTHFARLILIDRWLFEGPSAQRPVIPGEYLLFSAVIEGRTEADRDAYLEALCAHAPAAVDAIWGECVEAPPAPAAHPREFIAYATRHELRVRAFFNHYDAAPARAENACAVRESVRAFAADTQYLPAPELRARFLDDIDGWIDAAGG
jgi:hypothetical protein